MSIGGGVTAIGLLLSSLAPNLATLFVTYGVILSIGTSCSFFSSLLALPLYFKKRLGFANGFVSAGSGVGGLTFSPLLGYLIERYGLARTFQLYSIFALLPLLGGFLIRRKSYGTDKPIKISSCFDVTLLRNRAFILFTMVMSLILFAYYIPYVHLVSIYWFIYLYFLGNGGHFSRKKFCRRTGYYIAVFPS